MNYGPQPPPGAFRAERSRDPRFAQHGQGRVGNEQGRVGNGQGHAGFGQGGGQGNMPGRGEDDFDGPDAYDEREPEITSADYDSFNAQEIRGVPRARDQLYPWFRKIVDSVEEEQNPLCVTLSQRVAKGGMAEVTTLEHDLASPTNETIDSLIQLAVNDICDAQFVGTKLTYTISVALSNNKKSIQNFVLEIPRARTNAVNDPPRREHHPDMSGALAMLMQQNGQLQQFGLEGASRGTDVLERDIERKDEEILQLKEENRRLRATQFDRDREMQMLLDGNLKRQFMAEEHRSKVELNTAIGDGFRNALPHLLPLLLPQNMAQALAVPLAMAGAVTGGAPGAMPGSAQQPFPGVPSAPFQGAPPPMAQTDASRDPARDMQMPDDADIIDELIREMEDDQAFFAKLAGVMQEKPRCMQLLMALVHSSKIRQQEREAENSQPARRPGHSPARPGPR